MQNILLFCVLPALYALIVRGPQQPPWGCFIQSLGQSHHGTAGSLPDMEHVS